MPHTYMRTTGPTSNGTTARCAVSKSWIGHAVRSWSARRRSMRSVASPLCRRLTVSSGGGERLDADRVLRASRRRTPAGRGCRRSRSSTVVRPSSSPTTSTSLVSGGSMSASAAAGTWWNAATTYRGGRGGLHLGGDRALRATRPGELRGPASRARWPSRSTTLPVELVGVGPSGRDRGVPDRGEDDQLGVGRVVVRAGSSPSTRSPQRSRSSSTTSAARAAVTGPQRHVVTRRREPGRDAPSRRPGPPQHADCMSESFAHALADPHNPEHLKVRGVICDGRIARCSSGVTPSSVGRPSKVSDVATRTPSPGTSTAC